MLSLCIKYLENGVYVAVRHHLQRSARNSGYSMDENCGWKFICQFTQKILNNLRFHVKFKVDINIYK